MSDYKLHHGNMDDVLREHYPDNHFHAIAQDPPYGIRFMGRAWDDFDIKKSFNDRNGRAANEEVREGRTTNGFGQSLFAGQYDLSLTANRKFQAWFTERCVHLYRVLRPGGYFLCFGSTRTHHRMFCAIEDAGFEIRDTLNWMFSSGFPKSRNNRELGLGSALKPAFEPICLARKPLDGNLEQNREKWGTGYLNIDACRIPGQPWKYGAQPDIRNAGFTPGEDREVYARNVVGGLDGRWPANLMHDGGSDVLSVFPDSDGQAARVGPEHGDRPSINTYGDWGPRPAAEPRGDSGSAARFFYEAKTSREDRNEGCEHFPSKPMHWSSGDQNPGTFQSPNTDRTSPNHWPTVKPTNLMRYMIRLITPKVEDATVLDAMMGSGSTIKAAMYEFVNAVGIDQEEEAVKIAEARCRHALRNRGTMNIF